MKGVPARSLRSEVTCLGSALRPDTLSPWGCTGRLAGFCARRRPCARRHLSARHPPAPLCTRRARHRRWAPGFRGREGPPGTGPRGGRWAASAEQAQQSPRAGQCGGLWGETRRRGDRSAPGARSSCQPPEALPSRPAGSEEAGSRTPPSGCLRPAGQPRSSSGRESFLPRPSRSRAPAPGPAPGGTPRPRLPLPAASALLPDPWGLGRPRRQRPRPTAHYDIFLPGLRRLRRHRQPDTARPAPANPGARHRPSDGSVHQ